MIAVTQEREQIYTIEIQEPELSWLIELSKSLGMGRSVMLGACFTKGIQHYYGMIREIDEHDKNKPTSEAKDHKTYNKGSCQG